MTVGDIAQLVTAGAAAFAAYMSWRNKHQIARVEHATNGMKAQLEAAAFQKGIKEGVQQEHDRMEGP